MIEIVCFQERRKREEADRRAKEEIEKLKLEMAMLNRQVCGSSYIVVRSNYSSVFVRCLDFCSLSKTYTQIRIPYKQVLAYHKQLMFFPIILKIRIHLLLFFKTVNLTLTMEITLYFGDVMRDVVTVVVVQVGTWFIVSHSSHPEHLQCTVPAHISGKHCRLFTCFTISFTSFFCLVQLQS